MFTDPTSQDDHTGLFCFDTHIIQSSNILDDIDVELSVGFVGVEIDHISQTSIGECRAKDWNIVLFRRQHCPGQSVVLVPE